MSQYIKTQPWNPRYSRPGTRLIPVGLGSTGAAQNVVASQDDPFRKFGQELSARVFSSIKKVTPEARDAAFQATLENIEPGLFKRTIDRAEQYVNGGMPHVEAAHAALASAASEGFMKEIIATGKTGKVAPNTLVGLGFYGYEALGFSLNPISIVKKTVDIVKDGVNAVGSGVVSVSKAIGSVSEKAAVGIWDAHKFVYDAHKWTINAVIDAPEWTVEAAKDTGEWVKGAAEDIADFTEDVVKKVADVGCKLLGTQAGQQAASAGATAFGAPPGIGAQGAAAVSEGLCNNVPEYIEPAPFPWVPIAIGGVAMIGIVILVK